MNQWRLYLEIQSNYPVHLIFRLRQFLPDFLFASREDFEAEFNYNNIYEIIISYGVDEPKRLAHEFQARHRKQYRNALLKAIVWSKLISIVRGSRNSIEGSPRHFSTWIPSVKFRQIRTGNINKKQINKPQTTWHLMKYSSDFPLCFHKNPLVWCCTIRLSFNDGTRSSVDVNRSPGRQMTQLTS